MNDTDKALNDKALKRYIHLPLVVDAAGTVIEIHVKLDDEGVAVDAYYEDDVEPSMGDMHIGGTWKLYSDMGVEVKEIENE